MHAVFVMLKVETGHLYEVADKIGELEVVSEMYSTIGDYDLLLKVYVEDLNNLGEVVTQHIHRIPHLRETKTILTFRTYELPPRRGAN